MLSRDGASALVSGRVSPTSDDLGRQGWGPYWGPRQSSSPEHLPQRRDQPQPHKVVRVGEPLPCEGSAAVGTAFLAPAGSRRFGWSHVRIGNQQESGRFPPTPVLSRFSTTANYRRMTGCAAMDLPEIEQRLRELVAWGRTTWSFPSDLPFGPFVAASTLH